MAAPPGEPVTQSVSLCAPVPRVLASAAATEALGAELAVVARPGMILCLSGELGSGKTTLARGFLRALGVGGAIKSPTFTLVEPYRTAGWDIFHFDLYRVTDGRELHEMGIADYFAGNTLCLIEWPDRGAGVLPCCDLEVRLRHTDMPGCRVASLTPHSDVGRGWMAALSPSVLQ